MWVRVYIEWAGCLPGIWNNGDYVLFVSTSFGTSIIIMILIISNCSIYMKSITVHTKLNIIRKKVEQVQEYTCLTINERMYNVEIYQYR